ncbi:MAG: hypothetical protein JJ893_18185, partial [Thalassospira sp.]|nr:hypothetical protein [Thalassospira sp.]
MTESEPRIQVGTFVVAFYDILGQSSRLGTWNGHLFPNGKDDSAWASMLQTIQEVARIRADFNGFLNGFNSSSDGYHVAHPGLQEELERLPNYQDIMDALPRGRIYKQAFSDSNIWFTPASDEQGNHFARQIAFIVMGVAFAHLFALSRGTGCRGGIAIGNGTDALNKLGLSHGDEIYGPVLKSAYDLENLHAVYPRVVVADQVVEF